jgi:hypothetical protein
MDGLRAKSPCWLRAIKERDRRQPMKKQMTVMLVFLLLTLVLAVPALATPPTEVSGNIWMSAPPANRTWRPAGNNCIVEVDLTFLSVGDASGTITQHSRIVSHGPCGPSGPAPGQYHETDTGYGTFTGTVLGVSGTYDYTFNSQLWPADPGEVLYTGRNIILSGSGGLANLHGVIEDWGVVGEPGAYAGRVHFDPKP